MLIAGRGGASMQEEAAEDRPRLLATAVAIDPADASASHGWMVVPGSVEADGPAALLLHVPPRVGPHPTRPLTVRLAHELAIEPEAVAATGRRAVLVFPPEEGGSGRRSVLEVETAPGALDGVWVDRTAAGSGALSPLPTLPDAGGFVGVAAAEGEVFVLFVDAVRGGPGGEAAAETDADGGLRLFGLRRGSWVAANVPGSAGATSAGSGAPFDAALIGDGAGVMLWIRRGEGPAVSYRGKRVPAREADGPTLDWTPLPEAMTPPGPPAGVAGSEWLTLAVGPATGGSSPERAATDDTGAATEAVAGGDASSEGAAPGGEAATGDVGTRPAGEMRRVALTTWTRGGPVPLAAVETPRSPIALVSATPSAGRILIATGEAFGGPRIGPAADVPRGRRELVLHELSASTGRVLAAGPIRRPSPISKDEFRILAFVLATLAGVVLVVVLRPPASSVVVLPPNMALAESGRRLFATLIDLVLLAFVTGTVMGVSPLELMTFSALFRQDASWLAVPAMLSLGVVYGAVLETTWGRTIGKWATGCRVVRVLGSPGDVPRALRFSGGLTRNLVKWYLPPVAALALFEPAGRHRGDGLAGAAVVVELEKAEDPSDQ